VARPSLFAFALLGLASSCDRPHRSVCPIALPDASAELTPETWFAVMLDNFDATTGRPVGEPLDCADRPILDPTRVEFGSIWSKPNAALLPARPLTAEDLTVAPGPEGTTLVWLTVEHYADGSGYGPLAWVERSGANVIVRALGGLRAGTRDPRFELERDWLVVHGQRCVEQFGCRSVVQILAHERDAFVTLAIEQPGVCTVPAELDLTRRAQQKLSDGRVREYTLIRSVHVLPNSSLGIDETLTVSETTPGSEPAVLRVANVQLPVERDGDRLVVPDSLWAEIQDEDFIEMGPSRWHTRY
jgi:hypothetical protein